MIGDEDDGREARPEHDGAIGVGMGGSCPACRAPVDLGQEFCLECGSPIRFTPRQRRAQRGTETRQAMPATTPVPPPRSGFPWIPFLVVLALIGGGSAFALMGGDEDSSNGGTNSGSTEPGLPTITNSQPETTSDTQTTTLQDCIPEGGGGTLPAEAAPAADGQLGGPEDGSAGQIPQLGADGADPNGSAFDDIPSTEPEGGEETVTVDQDEQLCDTDGATGGVATDPASAGTTAEPGTGATAAGDWPDGKRGWTVIVAGYDAQDLATQRAADVQEDGFRDGGVLFSSDYASLCPGFYVVFSGVFDTEAQAAQQLDRLEANPDYAGMYVREIRTDGAQAAGCTAVASR